MTGEPTHTTSEMAPHAPAISIVSPESEVSKERNRATRPSYTYLLLSEK